MVTEEGCNVGLVDRLFLQNGIPAKYDIITNPLNNEGSGSNTGMKYMPGLNLLYPAIEPYKTHILEVGSGHKVYVEECGNPNGLPVLFVHGGPGLGCSAEDRRYFDPNGYRIILFDQRGCGRSTPFGSIENNTTQDLIRDMETIRQKLGVESWMLFGGSWGATLSLLYAQENPDKVRGMILRGIFLGRQQDMDWLYKEGEEPARIFPQYWKEFKENIPKTEGHDLLKAYYNRIHDKNSMIHGYNSPLVKMNAMKNWVLWEKHCSTLEEQAPSELTAEKINKAITLSIMETHYFINQNFIKPNQILENMAVLKDIPAIIIHGQRDMVCSVANATALHEAWSNSELHINPATGHSAEEPMNLTKLVEATSKMAIRFNQAVHSCSDAIKTPELQKSESKSSITHAFLASEMPSLLALQSLKYIYSETFFGVKDNLNGIKEVFLHPIKTATGLFETVRHPILAAKYIARFAKNHPIRFLANVSLSIIEGRLFAAGLQKWQGAEFAPLINNQNLEVFITNTTAAAAAAEAAAAAADSYLSATVSKTSSVFNSFSSYSPMRMCANPNVCVFPAATHASAMSPTIATSTAMVEFIGSLEDDHESRNKRYI